MGNFTLQRVFINLTGLAIALGLFVAFPRMATSLSLLLLLSAPTLMVIAIACYFSKNRRRTIVVVALGGFLGWLCAHGIEDHPSSFWDRFLRDYILTGPVSAIVAGIVACIEWWLAQRSGVTHGAPRVRCLLPYVLTLFGFVLVAVFSFWNWRQSATQVPTYSVYAIVSDARFIRLGTPVIWSGRTIGSIRNIEGTDGVGAVVELQITDDWGLLQSDELVLDTTRSSGAKACLVFRRHPLGRSNTIVERKKHKLRHGDVINVRLLDGVSPQQEANDHL